MRFLREKNTDKTILIISDIHLGAGAYVDGRKNPLEDFYHDKELVDFLTYHSTDKFQNREVELIINGDFIDLLAVPYVKFFDDEFWSEKASIEKLKLVVHAHKEVFEALSSFITKKNKKLIYIIGNHDAELILPGVKQHLLEVFPIEAHSNIEIICNCSKDYSPHKGIIVKHGHEFEIAHYFDPEDSIISDENKNLYFLPSWGHYFVTRIINKFKEEKGYVHSVRPVRKFLINGLIYDTLFTMRFMVAVSIYFIVVRFIYFIKQEKRIVKSINSAKAELELFKDPDDDILTLLNERDDVSLLVVGHSHRPEYRTTPEGKSFINTGTWTKMHDLDFGRQKSGTSLTYAKIDILKQTKDDSDRGFEENLYVWKGQNVDPFTEFL